jgi:RNAse (barnase) inhibitor barstar
MKRIWLDASEWKTPCDFYSALLPALGAPDWHGRNLDALFDSLSGGINRLDPPFRVEIAGAEHQSSEMNAFLQKGAAVFSDARNDLGADVSCDFV